MGSIESTAYAWILIAKQGFQSPLLLDSCPESATDLSEQLFSQGNVLATNVCPEASSTSFTLPQYNYNTNRASPSKLRRLL
jgi:hypothetical protein